MVEIIDHPVSKAFPLLIQIKACLRELCHYGGVAREPSRGQRENQQMNFGWFTLLGDLR